MRARHHTCWPGQPAGALLLNATPSGPLSTVQPSLHCSKPCLQLLLWLMHNTTAATDSNTACLGLQQQVVRQACTTAFLACCAVYNYISCKSRPYCLLAMIWQHFVGSWDMHHGSAASMWLTVYFACPPAPTVLEAIIECPKKLKCSNKI